VGIVDKADMITGSELEAGDVLIGIASSGIHSNGYSLVRKVFTIEEKELSKKYDSLGMTLGEALLTPTKIYVKALSGIKGAGVKIKACSHITGGGFYENIPRMLKEGTNAHIKEDSFEVPPIFELLAKEGNIDKQMMFNTYNMGIGMMIAVAPDDVVKAVEAIKVSGEKPYIVGEIAAGEKGITLE
jgi:phosphoribosylformylglycinamidine cyclo-ligase